MLQCFKLQNYFGWLVNPNNTCFGEMCPFIGRGRCKLGCYGPKSSVCPHVGRFRAQHPAETPTPAGEAKRAGRTMPSEWLNSLGQSHGPSLAAPAGIVSPSLKMLKRWPKTGLRENWQTAWRGISFDVWENLLWTSTLKLNLAHVTT